MNSPQLSPARRYIYENAIHRIESDELLSDFEDQKEIDRLSRTRRSSLRTRIESLRAKGGHLFGPDNAQWFPSYIRELHGNAGLQSSLSCGNPPEAQAEHQVLDAPCAADAAPTRHQPRRRKTKGRHIAARMMAVTSKNSEAIYWTLKKWANHLCCSTGTIGNLPLWRQIMQTRAKTLLEHAENADQTAFRPNGGRSRKQRNRQ